MRKKILGMLALFGMSLCATGCNKTIIDVNLKFDKIHLYETSRCYEIKEWNDYDGEQIQVKLPNGTILLTSTQKCMLINGACPICESGE